jgi:hypothetical protein
MQNDITKPPTSENSEPEVQQSPRPIQDIAKPTSSEQSPPPPSVPEHDAVENTPSNTSQPDPKEKVADQSAEQLSDTVTKPRSNFPIAAIVGAALVCVLLIGGVVYMTLDSSKDSSNQTTSQQSPKPATTAEDLKKVGNEVDGLPEPGADISPELSDQALGL